MEWLRFMVIESRILGYKILESAWAGWSWFDQQMSNPGELGNSEKIKKLRI